MSNQIHDIHLTEEQRDAKNMARIQADLLNTTRESLRKQEEFSRNLTLIKGDKGERGEKGEVGKTGARGLKGDRGDRGEKGEAGKNGSNGNDGLRGKDGKNGNNGINGKDGKPGKNGNNGLNGKHGSPDTAEDIKKKLVSLKGTNRLPHTAIYGLHELISRHSQGPGQGVMYDGGGDSSSSSSSNAITIEVPGGTINGSNTSFTVTAEPEWIVADGATYFAGKGYTYSSLTVTMDNAPTQYIEAFISVSVTSRRIQPRSSTAASGDITPDLSVANIWQRTAQADSLTINAPTGTPVLGEVLVFMILDDGLSRVITWNTAFTAKVMETALPILTTPNKQLLVTAQYNGSKWLALSASEI